MLAEEPDKAYGNDGKPLHYSFIAPSQLRLRCYKWPTENPKAVAILLHGIDSHGRFSWLSKLAPASYEDFLASRAQQLRERCDVEIEGRDPPELLPPGAPCEPTYQGSFVEMLNKWGYEVWSMDHQSHGLSEGLQGYRGYWRNPDALARDARYFVDLVLDQTELPCVCFGSSLGGNVLLRLLQMGDLRRPLAAAVFCGGMFCLDSRRETLPYSALKYVVKGLSHCLPQMVLSKESTAEVYPWIYDYTRPDPYHNQAVGSRAAVIEALFAMTDIIHDFSNWSDVQCERFLVLHNKLDPVCELRGALAVYDKLHEACKEVELIVCNSTHRDFECSRDLKPFSVQKLEGIDVSHVLIGDPDLKMIVNHAVVPFLQNVTTSH
ncbi:MAG: hypothetical protein KVP17_000398 [Porospora cf. gigantea B]|nr:MAG: hypothetical protein KVP17_000398 [Porospora cf. gigantea B]